jgi:hypothetical protein
MAQVQKDVRKEINKGRVFAKLILLIQSHQQNVWYHCV